MTRIRKSLTATAAGVALLVSLAAPGFADTGAPVRGILKTPSSGQRGGHRLEPETPLSSKKRVKKTDRKSTRLNSSHSSVSRMPSSA